MIGKSSVGDYLLVCECSNSFEGFGVFVSKSTRNLLEIK